MVRIQKRLREILVNENQGTRHENLVALAKKVGVSILQYKGGANGYGPADETELVARIREVGRTNCIVITSVAAVVSAITALLSAIAAWTVFVCK
jgi:hypothetical protein